MFSNSKIAYLSTECPEWYMNICVEEGNSPYYGETDRHLKVTSGEHIEISPLAFVKVEPSKESAIRDHLQICSNIPFFDTFTILAYGQNKFIFLKF